MEWDLKSGDKVRVHALLPPDRRVAVLDEKQLWPGDELVEREKAFTVRITPGADRPWDTFLNVVRVGASDIAARTVRSDDGEAEGVLIEGAARESVVLLFNAKPGGGLAVHLGPEANQHAFEQARLMRRAWSIRSRSPRSRPCLRAPPRACHPWTVEADGGSVPWQSAIPGSSSSPSSIPVATGSRSGRPRLVDNAAPGSVRVTRSRMRVLHVLHNSLPLVCGYSIRSGTIVRLQRQEGYDLRVVTSAQHPNGSAAVEEIDGVAHRRTPSYDGPQWPIWREWQLMLRLEREVEAVVAQWRPDVVHAHSPVIVGLPALRVARRHHLPLVYEVRDLWENALVDRRRFGEGSVQYKVARWAESHVLSRADAVVTICDTLRDELAPRCGDESKVSVVANGVDAEAFQPRSPSVEALAKYGLGSKRVILYVGTFQPYEGLALLVRSLPHVLARVPDAHLVIVGGSASLAYRGGSLAGTQEEVLARVVEEMKLEAHVTLTGRVPHAEVGSLYSIADCVVYPRIYTRTTALTTPLKPLEAMAMARAVVVSDLGPMRELVREGETGLTFPAGDERALAERCTLLLQDAPARERLGHAAREAVLVERQWPALVRRYEDVYARATIGRQ